jgi:hypothetical protein
MAIRLREYSSISARRRLISSMRARFLILKGSSFFDSAICHDWPFFFVLGPGGRDHSINSHTLALRDAGVEKPSDQQ